MAKTPKKMAKVVRWLKDYLSSGSRSESVVKEAANREGFSLRTVARAKASLGIESVRRGSVYVWRDPDVLEEVQGSLTLVAAIQELTRAVRQLAKSSAVTAVITPNEREDEPVMMEPALPTADPKHLAETARELFRLGKPLEAIKTELLEIAHKYPCDPPLADVVILGIAELYHQKQIEQAKQLPEILTTDDPYGLLERTDYGDIRKLREAVRARQLEIQDDKSKKEEYDRWSAWATESFKVERRKRPARP
jgi:hypothetical protein